MSALPTVEYIYIDEWCISIKQIQFQCVAVESFFAVTAASFPRPFYRLLCKKALFFEFHTCLSDAIPNHEVGYLKFHRFPFGILICLSLAKNSALKERKNAGSKI